jgi:hypothetical protein
VEERLRYIRRLRSKSILDPARDPFAETVIDYTYNLAASGALLIAASWCDLSSFVPLPLSRW